MSLISTAIMFSGEIRSQVIDFGAAARSLSNSLGDLGQHQSQFSIKYSVRRPNQETMSVLDGHGDYLQDKEYENESYN